VFPSLQVAVASPLVFVVLVEVIVPPPLLTAHVTVAPLTGLLFASTARTASAVGSCVPTVAVCASPLTFCTLVPVPAPPVAVKFTGVSPLADAVTAFGPAVVARVNWVLAKPCSSVVEVAGLTLPPPAVTSHVTVTPLTPLPY
jgi:hypothetical protein